MSNSTLIFATHNKHKLIEVRAILGGNQLITGLTEIGMDEPIPETGSTLEENALNKARWVYIRMGKAVFADDSGLVVPALDGAPGVFSARYAGKDCNDEDNCRLLMKNMEGLAERSAYFRCVIAYINSGVEQLFYGEVGGSIASVLKGSKGFGYDPLFIPSGYQMTFAEMDQKIKHTMSHRAKALLAFNSFLEKQLGKN